jgi:cardiolipin synthase A/B
MEEHRHSWQFFLSTDAAWEAMYGDCALAKESIELEQYILGRDALGRRFMELFTEKAASGVKVFVICDKFGSLKLFGSSLVRRFRKKGGHFYFFNPITRWNIITPWRWFPRTHMKTLLIDSSVAYVGGVCMAQRMSGWRDTQMRIRGPAVEYVRRAFAAIEHGLTHHKKPEPVGAPPEGCDFRYLLNQSKHATNRIYQELVAAIDRARRYVYISTAFFVPHRSFFDLLRRACQRGVEVILLVPQRSDTVLADWVCLSYCDRLLEEGVRVYHYQGRVLHCKTAVIDDEWATMGSMNLDVISFFHNREANLIITDPVAIGELKLQFHTDLSHSIEFTVDSWKRLPVWKQLAGCLARVLKIFL